PRIYTSNVAYEQELFPDWTGYVDFTLSKGVHLTAFPDVNANGLFDARGNTVIPPNAFGPQLGGVALTSSTAKSLYRGLTIGMRKRFSQHWQLEWNYVLSEDLDNDSNERDPFDDFRVDPVHPERDYHFSNRDQRHRFNLYSYSELPAKFNLNLR